MFLESQLEQIARTYSEKIASKPKKEWTPDEIGKILRQYADDVAKLVRDATLRFHQSNMKQEPIPAELADMPLFRNLPPYIPPLPPGAQPTVRVETV